MELRIENVSKNFKEKKAVDGVSLRITEGIWGLLGANGSGKTTLMRIVAGVMEPAQGQVLYDGIPIRTLGRSYRDIFGYLPQEFGFYPEFTVKDYLEYAAAIKGLSARQTKRRVEKLLESLTLTEVYKKKIVRLSGGMKRRVGIAQALLNDPQVLVLDEPTSGLDPGERIRLRNLLSGFAQERIVLISTHIVSDIEYISTRNALMKQGKIAASGTTEELVAPMEGKVYTCLIPAEEVRYYEKKLRIVNLRNEEGGQVSVRYLAEEPGIEGSKEAVPRLEDLYLWMFPADMSYDGKGEQREGSGK